jgi:ATP-dependent RNA helicase DDX18/HAS1
LWGQLEKLISKNYYLHQSARDGYRSYLQAYASYSLKNIFDINKLDLRKVGKAFGFSVPPKVNISIGTSLKAGKKARRGRGDGSDSDEDAGSDEDVRGPRKQSRQDDGKPVKAYYRSNHQKGRPSGAGGEKRR